MKKVVSIIFSLAAAGIAAGQATTAAPPATPAPGQMSTQAPSQNPSQPRTAPTAPHTNLKVGQAAPDFNLPSTIPGADGRGAQRYKLSDFKGKKNVVLAFYVLAFTGG